ncbi:DMT family transporter [Alicyclobacillus fastidiosus]|uniref:DMT family transporter n=1 Tax=Alicyclobacillus fastidiosus TaxID=392011 RepID=A0ABV5AB10_9BACL|nr:DMT family transporter [Alicyclobacillus fastidiosus]WEH10575.1 DMT family transporter [Alicyclobacillus fastidiosus]
MSEEAVASSGTKYGVNLVSTISAILIWSTSFVATKISYVSFSPFTLGFLRFFIATVVLVIVVLIRREFRKVSFRDFGLLSLSGILGITFYFALENTGVKFTSASDAAMIVSSYPAVTSLLELLVFKVKTTFVKTVGIALTVGGVCELSFSAHMGLDTTQLLGNILLVIAGVVWTFYNFVTSMVVNSYPATTVSLYQTVIGTTAFIPLAGTELHQWTRPNMESFLALLYLGICCSVVAFLLYNYGLRKLTSSTVVTMMNLVPVFGVMFSVLILHENLELKQLIGGIIVLVGVYLTLRQYHSKRHFE